MVSVGFLFEDSSSTAIPSCRLAAFDIGNCDLVDLCCNICIGDLDVLAKGMLHISLNTCECWFLHLLPCGRDSLQFGQIFLPVHWIGGIVENW